MNTKPSPGGQIEPILRQRREYNRLLALAAQMARREGMPDFDDHAWPKRTPRHVLRGVRQAESRAHDRCGEWATELRAIADAIFAESRKAMAPSNIEGRSAGF